jgi:hypothetical protein
VDMDESTPKNYKEKAYLAMLSHGLATEDGIPASTLWVSAAGERHRTQQHMAQLKMSLV